MKKNDFEKTLIEVRKAYRLIYLYQRRVLDLVNFIGSKLSLNLYGGWSKFSKPAGINTRVKLKKSSWDWLMLYFYDFHFGQIKENIWFSIILQSDTGFFESNSNDKFDISKFKDAEESNTRLIFVLGVGDWGCPISGFLEEYLNGQESEFIKEVDKNKKWLGKAYNLTEFMNEESTIKIINNFVKFAKNNGIEIIEKNEVQQAV